MRNKQFASWVEPIARRDRKARAAFIEVARAVPSGAWLRRSPVEGWAYKDVLAHVAGDTGKWFSHIFRSVLDGEALDPERAGPRADIDALNGRDVYERRSRAVAELVAEIESDGEEHQKQLSRLDDEQSEFKLAAYSMSLREFLTTNPAGNRAGHDDEHGAQLRSALEGT